MRRRPRFRTLSYFFLSNGDVESCWFVCSPIGNVAEVTNDKASEFCCHGGRLNEKHLSSVLAAKAGIHAREQNPVRHGLNTIGAQSTHNGEMATSYSNGFECSR